MLAATSLAVFLLTPFDASIFNSDSHSCLASSFYGNYGGQSLFVPSPDCLAASTQLLSSGSILPASRNVDDAQLVWVEEASVEDVVRGGDLSFGEELDSLLAEASIVEGALMDGEEPSMDVTTSGEPQLVLESVATPKGQYELLHRTASSALLALSPELARNLAFYPPRLWKILPVPATPVEYIPVPSPAIEPVRQLLASLKFDPVVEALVNSISVRQMRRDIEYLTGEDEDSPITSRHSFAQGSRTAAAFLKKEFESTGGECELKDFLTGFAPNVVCRYPATTKTTATVIISAHYDSRGSFGNVRAPGGDDDGSGTMAILAIARAIKLNHLAFRANVELCAFAGEEQGLYGSRAYARELRSQDANVTLMIQADMLAYHVEGERPQLGLPQYIGTPEVTQLVANISALYSPELSVGFTSACCSDHQSFHEQGFPASQVFERAGPIADPMYHNSGDLSDRVNYDFDQVKSIAKVQFATVLHAAGFDIRSTHLD